MSPTEINSLQDALLVGAATTRGRQASLISVLEGNSRSASGDGEDGDSGIGSEPTSGPSSGLTSGHGSHVLDTANGAMDPSTLLSGLSLNAKGSRTRPPFRAHDSHKLHITSMEHGLMDQLAIRLLESIFFDNRQVAIAIGRIALFVVCRRPSCHFSHRWRFLTRFFPFFWLLLSIEMTDSSRLLKRIRH